MQAMIAALQNKVETLGQPVAQDTGRNLVNTQPRGAIQAEKETVYKVDGYKQDKKEAEDDAEAFLRLPKELGADAKGLWGNQWTEPNTDNAVTHEELVTVLNNQIPGIVPTTVFTHVLEEQPKGNLLFSSGATATPETLDQPSGESAGREVNLLEAWIASGKPYPPTAPPEKWLDNFRTHNNIEGNVRKS
jgi:hypothetical protein